MPIFNGTAGNDSLTGGAANDTLNGLAGNDTLNGGAGADRMDGGIGNDVYIVDNLGDIVVEGFSGGTDTVRTSVLDALATYSIAAFANVENLAYTGTAAAQLKGNSLANLIQANSAASTADTLYGAAGNDTLLSYGGNDSLIGGVGNDSLDGGVGNDMMVGGTGNDTFVIDAAGDRAFEYLNGGFDTIRSTTFKDLRPGWANQIEGLTYFGAAAAVLHGNALGNAITSSAATNDTLNGYDGNDTLDGGGGTDSMLGGLGDDFYMASATDIVVELAGQGTDGIAGAKTSIAIAAFATTIENLFYTSATGAALTGNAMANIVAGGAGNDTVNGGDGNDSLAGGLGADSLLGGNGDDDFYGGGLLQFQFLPGLQPDAVVDTLVGGAGNDLYWIDAANDVITEIAGGGTRDVVVTSIDNSLTRYANVEAMVLRSGTEAWYGRGGTGNDILVGNEGDNYLVGGAGNDTISGNVNLTSFFGFASDVLDGGDGADVLVAFGFANFFSTLQEVTLFGGAGDDLYVIGANFAGIGGLDSGGVDTALLLGNASIEALEGVENIVLYNTGSTATELKGRGAIDAVNAAANRGASFAGSLGTAVSATGNAIANTITGNNQNNTLFGLGGNDTINGGAGNDTIDGGVGTDSLIGGAGNDTFVVDGADVVVEAVGGGFDIISSATLTSYAAYANTDGLQFTGSNAVSLSNGAANTSNDFFGGGNGNDTLQGFAGNDTLDGGAGNDSILGGAGVDSLLGGAGNDSVDGGTENDNIAGGAGVDSLLGGDGNDFLFAESNNFFFTETNANTLRGGNGNDNLTGSLGNDSLFGDAGNDTLNGEDGNDALDGGADNDSLIGGEGNDILSAGTQTNSGQAFSATGDILWGNEQFGAGGTDADQFRIAAPTVANKAIETFAGSGTFMFNTGALVSDFVASSDTIRFAAAMVGDNDALLESVSEKVAAGGTFSSTAEMVIFRADAAGTFNSGGFALAPFASTVATTVIGSADAAFAAGAERLFVIDNGSSSAIFQFTAANADAAVTVDELSLLAIVNGNSTLVATDFSLF